MRSALPPPAVAIIHVVREPVLLGPGNGRRLNQGIAAKNCRRVPTKAELELDFFVGGDGVRLSWGNGTHVFVHDADVAHWAACFWSDWVYRSGRGIALVGRHRRF